MSRVRKRARTEDLDSGSAGRPHILREAMATTDNPEREAYGHELKRVLERAIDSLPQDYRCVFVLRIVEELSIAETAECLDLTIETVKTRLHRGQRSYESIWSAGRESRRRKCFRS
ncbi:MAG: sigma-70 family RNA polymerase sigma factor, partial [Acidobacteriaceae bacterium]|nr:sigma-70 family RNA polymerase sigma factor [Acidobacteriaceae bacterium]